MTSILSAKNIGKLGILAALAFVSAVGCKHATNASQVKVLGGIDTNTRPDVVKIINLDTNQFCTGTFVNDNTLITASHCISVNSVGGGVALFDHRSIVGIAKFFLNASVASGCTGRAYLAELVDICPGVDLAIVVFPRGTAKGLGITAFSPLSSGQPSVGSRIVMLGFGPKVKDGPSGIKNFSWGNISANYGEHLTIDAGSWSAPNFGREAGILPGDSGGPVFNGNGELLGVNSGFRWWDDGGFRSFVVNLRGQNAAAVFSYALQYSDVTVRPLPIPGF